MIDKIKELFAMLPRTEQLELLRDLNSSISSDNPVTRVNEYNQQFYGKNISFNITNIGTQYEPNIKVELITSWGVYEAFGANQRVAKTRAAEIALESFPENGSNDPTLNIT